jgi:hypothetical protein
MYGSNGRRAVTSTLLAPLATDRPYGVTVARIGNTAAPWGGAAHSSCLRRDVGHQNFKFEAFVYVFLE